MQEFLIGPMCVTKEDFEQQLNSYGLKFGYIIYIARIHSDGSMEKVKADFCPKCGRKLEEL